MVLNIINGNFGLAKSWQKSLKPIGARVLFVPFWSHSKPHTKAQLEWPKRLVQLDNQLDIRGEAYRILRDMIVEWNGVYVSVSHSLILLWKLIGRAHFLGASGIGWRLKVFPSSSNICFWISPHQGTLSCS